MLSHKHEVQIRRSAFLLLIKHDSFPFVQWNLQPIPIFEGEIDSDIILLWIERIRAENFMNSRLFREILKFLSARITFQYFIYHVEELYLILLRLTKHLTFEFQGLLEWTQVHNALIRYHIDCVHADPACFDFLVSLALRWESTQLPFDFNVLSLSNHLTNVMVYEIHDILLS